MPKYYVHSGAVSMVVSANDAEGAALWAIHQNSRLPELVESDCVDDLDWQDMLPAWASDEFDDSIAVSERGLGRNDAGQFATEAALVKYGQLLVAVERLLGE